MIPMVVYDTHSRWKPIEHTVKYDQQNSLFSAQYISVYLERIKGVETGTN